MNDALQRKGVDYFPLDVHLDNKIRFIEARFGLEGFAIIIKILQEIYSTGYYACFNEDECLLFATKIGVEYELIRGIIEEAIKRDLFDENLYKTHKILTSRGVQRRYTHIAKRRKNFEIKTEFNLLENDDVDIFGENVSKNEENVNKKGKNVSNFQQSKVKERKGKERKGKYYEFAPLNQAIFDFIEYRKIMRAPMTERAVELLILKLDKLAENNDEKIAILEQSIIQGWKGVFELKQDLETFKKRRKELPKWYKSYQQELEEEKKKIKPKEKDLTPEELKKLSKEMFE